MNFGEKEFEYIKGENLPVWQSPKYLEAKKKAIETIESDKYGLCESDFWILMNATKTDKMAYTSLIISHNGCLKINDALDSKFNPACVTFSKDGYKNSLVFIYCNEEQGIFEVGEVSSENCKNAYPYAMALKRCFDRVVLKLSKLAYSGIMSDSESESESESEEIKNNQEFAELIKVDDIRIKTLKSLCEKTQTDETQIFTFYKINSFDEMNETQFQECLKRLSSKKEIKIKDVLS